MKSKLQKLIEEATVDCYGEDEQFSGWACTLEDQIKCPQACTASKNAAKLLKISETKGGRSINAMVEISGKRLLVPIEAIDLKDKRQNNWILAYKEWL